MTSQRQAPDSPPTPGDPPATAQPAAAQPATAQPATAQPATAQPAWPGYLAPGGHASARPAARLAGATRRLLPAAGLAVLLLVGFSSTVWWGPALAGKTAWALPDDLWGTLVAANRLLHGDIAGVYTPPTGLITFPGGAVIMMPAVAVIDLLGWSLHSQGPGNEHPLAWLLAGPYETLISGLALFAADGLAEQAGAGRRKRLVLAAASTVALWNVSIRWGHPEDAVAVGLILYAISDLAKGKTARAAWLTGAAVAIQPLVLLAIPVLLVAIRPRRMAGFLLSAATPATVLLAVAAAANWHATFTAVFRQPNWPTVDHPTPWLALATRLPGGAVAAGPVRLIAIAASLGCAALAWRQCRAAGTGARWDEFTLLKLLWWVAVSLALRSVFEPVMVAYYLWPVLAVTLIAAVTTWPRLIATSVMAGTLTFVSQSQLRGEWAWWVPMVLGLALMLVFSQVGMRGASSPGVATTAVT